MRPVLFYIISRSNLLVFKIIKGIGEFLIYVNGRIGWVLLRMIDRQRLDHAEAASDQENEISELNVLTSINEVRNDAMKSGKWHDGHEDTLNYLGNLLANEYDWEVDEVERYIYEVIASGPSLKEK